MAVYSFGSSKFGQLGLGGTEEAVTEPQIIEHLKGKRIVKVSCGELHSLALGQYGDVYSWGRGREGQLGTREVLPFSPIPLHVKSLRHEKIVDIACGNFHCIAVAESGRVYMWGKLYRNGPGNARSKWGISVELPGLATQELVERSIREYLGGDSNEETNGTGTGSHLPNFGEFLPYTQAEPMLLDIFVNIKKKIVSCATGYNFSAFITSDGLLYTQGFNEKGQLGLGNRVNAEEPTLVYTLAEKNVSIIGVACGQQHTCALSSDGQLWTFGLGAFGQLGHGYLHDELVPKRIESLIESNTIIESIKCGSFYSVAKSKEGDLYSWGHSEYGQHSGSQQYSDWDAGGRSRNEVKEKNKYYATPRLLEGISILGKKIKMFTCGHLHTVAVTTTDEVYSFGWNTSGCLGIGHRRLQIIPALVYALQGDSISCISAGWKHTLAVKGSDETTFAFDFKNLPAFSNVSSPLVLTDQDLIFDFETEGKSIAVHKVFVFARCPHLKKIALFHHRFGSHVSLSPSEAKSKKVIARIAMKGIKYNVFQGLINYIYTDHIKVSSHVAKDLLQIAHKYGLERLVQLCKRTIEKEQYLVPSSTEEIAQVNNALQYSSFCEDLETAIDNSDSSDLTFRSSIDSNDKKVAVHKCILRSRSNYFERLFGGEFKEKDMLEHTVPVSVETLNVIFQYLYLGNALVNPENAIDILEAAQYFMLDDLFNFVEAYIIQTVDIENCVQLLHISEQFGAFRLKRICQEFFLSNWENVTSTDGFKDIATSNPQLIRDLDYRLCKQGNISSGQLMKLAAKQTRVH